MANHHKKQTKKANYNHLRELQLKITSTSADHW